MTAALALLLRALKRPIQFALYRGGGGELLRQFPMAPAPLDPILQRELFAAFFAPENFSSSLSCSLAKRPLKVVRSRSHHVAWSVLCAKPGMDASTAESECSADVGRRRTNCSLGLLQFMRCGQEICRVVVVVVVVGTAKHINASGGGPAFSLRSFGPSPESPYHCL